MLSRMLRSRRRSLHSCATRYRAKVQRYGPARGGIEGYRAEPYICRRRENGDPISLPAAYDTFVTRVLLDKRPRSKKLAQGTRVEMRSSQPVG